MDVKQTEKCALKILEPLFPDKSIVDLKINPGSLAGDNFTCNIYSIEVTFKENDKATNSEPTNGSSGQSIEHFVLKCFPDNRDRCEFIVKTQIFKKEVLVYQELIPELIKFQEDRINKNQRKKIISPFPKYIAGSYEEFDSDNSTNDSFARSIEHNYVILEDIRYSGNYQTSSRKFDGLDYNHCKVAIVELAKVHALSLVYRKTQIPGKLLNEKFSCMEETLITYSTEVLRSKILETCATVGINVLEKEVSKDSPYFQKVSLFKGKILQVMAHFLSGNGNRLTFSEMINTAPNLDNLHSQNKELKLTDEWHVFCHGDFWASNILFKYSENDKREPIAAKFVDFQLSRENCLTTDLIFLFYASTTADFRNDHMNQLLTLYFDSFMEVCHMYDATPWKNFSLKNLFAKITKAKLWGVALSLLGLPIIYSGNDSNEGNNLQEGLENHPFGGVGRGDVNKTKKLATQLLGIAKEVVDEGII